MLEVDRLDLFTKVGDKCPYFLPHAAKCLKSIASISLLKLETNVHIFVLSMIMKIHTFDGK